jgi:hypothetical protein
MGNSLGNVIWQIGQFQFANMGPTLARWDPTLRLYPFQVQLLPNCLRHSRDPTYTRSLTSALVTNHPRGRIATSKMVTLASAGATGGVICEPLCLWDRRDAFRTCNRRSRCWSCNPGGQLPWLPNPGLVPTFLFPRGWYRYTFARNPRFMGIFCTKNL